MTSAKTRKLIPNALSAHWFPPFCSSSSGGSDAPQPADCRVIYVNDGDATHALSPSFHIPFSLEQNDQLVARFELDMKQATEVKAKNGSVKGAVDRGDVWLCMLREVLQADKKTTVVTQANVDLQLDKSMVTFRFGQILAPPSSVPCQLVVYLRKMSKAEEVYRSEWRLLGVTVSTLTTRFLFNQKLGSGTFARVDSAYDWKLQQNVAVKLFNAREASVDQVELELSVMRSCRERSCRHLVHLLDCPAFELNLEPEFERGLGFERHKVVAVMPLHGLSLEAERRRRVAKSASFSFEEIAEFWLGCAMGLAELHAAQFCHGDVAARNVLLDGAARVVLADFGRSEAYNDELGKTDVRQLANLVQQLVPSFPTHLDDLNRVAARSRAGDMLPLELIAEIKAAMERDKKALHALEQEAAQGSSSAQYQLGLRYLTGQRFKQAVDWFRKAAASNEPAAEYQLGLCYANGIGTDKDEKQAVACYMSAAKKQLVDAQFAMGLCCWQGRGIEQDKKQAMDWYRRAAEKGHMESQFLLAVALAHGDDNNVVGALERNRVEAEHWYEAAAKQGHQTAAVARAALKTSWSERRQCLQEAEDRGSIMASLDLAAALLGYGGLEHDDKSSVCDAIQHLGRASSAAAAVGLQNGSSLTIRVNDSILSFGSHELSPSSMVSGRGHFGSTRLYMKLDQTAVAVKSYHNASLQTILHELIALLASQSHPNVVRLLGILPDVANDNNKLRLVMQHAYFGSLRSIFQTDKRTMLLQHQQCILSIFQDAARGLAHIHARNLIHRNIHAGTLLLDSRGRVVIAGFSLCRFLDSQGLSKLECDLSLPFNLHSCAHDDQGFGLVRQSEDICMLGLAIIELLNGKKRLDRSDALDWLWKHKVDGRVAAALFKCLEQDEKQRPSAEALCNMLQVKEGEEGEPNGSLVLAHICGGG